VGERRSDFGVRREKTLAVTIIQANKRGYLKIGSRESPPKRV
jgi:hypothetical protein